MFLDNKRSEKAYEVNKKPSHSKSYVFCKLMRSLYFSIVNLNHTYKDNEERCLHAKINKSI